MPEDETQSPACPTCGKPAIDFRGTDEAPTHYLCQGGHLWPVGDPAQSESGAGQDVPVTGPPSTGDIPPPDPAQRPEAVLARDILAILAERDGHAVRSEVGRRCVRELEELGCEVPNHRTVGPNENTPFQSQQEAKLGRRDARG